eukprot:evm.model.scf_419EXC.6 EVM.evm.TU.scf_419EXC.6   scf_419EXC:49227-49853(-)
MACPRCSANIQRNGGCNHMVCTMCGNHFCYKCGMDWKGHDDFYNCSRGRPLNDDDDRQEAAVDPPDAGGRKGLFSSICSLFNSVVGGYWWEWHVQQYSMHDCNDRHLNAVGAYMGALLCLGVPPPGECLGSADGYHYGTGNWMDHLALLSSSAAVLHSPGTFIAQCPWPRLFRFHQRTVFSGGSGRFASTDATLRGMMPAIGMLMVGS